MFSITTKDFFMFYNKGKTNVKFALRNSKIYSTFEIPQCVSFSYNNTTTLSTPLASDSTPLSFKLWHLRLSPPFRVPCHYHKLLHNHMTINGSLMLKGTNGYKEFTDFYQYFYISKYIYEQEKNWSDLFWLLPLPKQASCKAFLNPS